MAVLLAACGGDEPRQGLAALSGHVTAPDGVSLVGVTVSLMPSGQETRTGDKGNYLFSRIDTGDYYVVFNKDGFDEEIREITIEQGVGNRLDVVLQPLGGGVEIEQTGMEIARMLDCGSGLSSVELLLDVNVGASVPQTWSIDISQTYWLKAASPLEGTLMPGHNELRCVFDVDRRKVLTGAMGIIALQIGTTYFPLVSRCRP